MKKTIAAIALLPVLCLSTCCLADPAKEPAYVSGKPLYAKVALDEKGTKVLTLAFDESAGTGKGYDTIYADLNLNGDLTDDKAIKGTLRKYGRSNINCTFHGIVVDVPYNEKAQGVKRPWELVINYNQLTRRRLFGLIQGETYRSFFLEGRMKLRDESGGEWLYSMSTSLEPRDSLSEASPIAFRGKTTLQVETKPDPRKKGNTGIATYLRLGDITFRCFKGGQAAKAQVLVKDQEGKTVHSEDVGMNKLFFG